MKISQIRSKLLATRTPSTEQGDIQITVNQGEQDNPAVDAGASMPPELTDPTASIADQPEVTDTLAEVDSDKSDMLDSTDAETEMSEAGFGADAAEEAVETLESYRAHVTKLRASGMPVSTATIEALTIGIEHAVGRFNLKASELGMPSTESFHANTPQSLAALEKMITVSQEGIIDSLNDFFNKYISKYHDFVVGVQRGLASQNKRLDKVIASATGIGAVSNLPVITNKGVIDKVESIVLDSTSGATALDKLKTVNGGIVDMFNTRIDTVEAAVVKAVEDIEKGGSDAAVSDKLRADITNVLYADNRSIQFWTSLTPMTSTLMVGSFIPIIIGVKVFKTIFGKATTKQPGPFRKKKPGVVILSELPTLMPTEIIEAAKSTKEAVAAAMAYKAEESANVKKLKTILDSKFKEAEKKQQVKEDNATDAEAGDDAAIKGGNLAYVRNITRDLYAVESAILRGVRFSVPGVVDYLVECVKIAQAAEKGASAETKPAE